MTAFIFILNFIGAVLMMYGIIAMIVDATSNISPTRDLIYLGIGAVLVIASTIMIKLGGKK